MPAPLRPAAEQLRQNLTTSWTPLDIHDFVFLLLPTVQRPDELPAVLRHGKHIDSAVHGWFVALAPAAQCFVFTLTLCQGLPLAELWQRHKEIVAALRQFDPLLGVLPLGLLRSKLRPFVDPGWRPALRRPGACPACRDG